jgi:hypothetical protein
MRGYDKLIDREYTVNTVYKNTCLVAGLRDGCNDCKCFRLNVESDLVGRAPNTKT